VYKVVSFHLQGDWGVLTNLLKFKGIQAPNIVKKSSGWRTSRIACEFEFQKLGESPISKVTWSMGLWLLSIKN